MSRQDVIRVVVVDDSMVMRRIIKGILNEHPEIEVVGVAVDGKEGLDIIARLDPDVVTLDIEMPVLDGLGALRKLRLRARDAMPAVLMCSSLTVEGSHDALTALQNGAADVIAKNPDTVAKGDPGFRTELITKVRAIAAGRRSRLQAAERASNLSRSELPSDAIRGGSFDVIAIGSSTGGPVVVERIVNALPADGRTPVVIAQHMPSVFTRSLAERLDRTCPPRVEIAQHRKPLEAGVVYVCEGGLHTRITGATKLGRFEVSPEPTELVYKPSADELLRTAAEHFGRRSFGIVLTGIGADGAQGAQAIADAGGAVVAQDEASSVVYGMPKAVAAKGIAVDQLNPDQLARLVGRVAMEASGAAIRAA